MLVMSKTEIVEIDKQLNGKLQWAKQNIELAEQLAMDATRLMSCTNDRLEDYKDKGFFNRCVSSFSGETAKMQRDNQDDIVAMQKMGWRYLQILNERDILMAHSLITIKNNLETLAVKEDETREEIARFATKVKDRFNSHAKRLDELEVAVDIQQWLTTVEVQDYDELYPKHMRLLCLVRDFKSKKAEDWNMKNILCLQQAIYNAKIDRKEKITLEQFVGNLIDEIEENSFEMFSEITTLNDYSAQKIDTSFLVEEIASPTFNSIYQISDNYSTSNIAVDTLIEHLNIEKKEAIKKIILGHIQNAGVDINKKIQLQDIALEILSCSKLAQELFEKKYPKKDNEGKNKIDSKSLKEIDYEGNETSPLMEDIKLLIEQPDLELSLMSKKIAVSNNFGILINNKGVLKAFGRNYSGCLGIGSRDVKDYDAPLSVIDLPQDIKCVSVDAGYDHSLVLLENGDVYAWGNASFGRLGDNTTEDRLSPFKVMGLPKDIMPVKVLAGAHSSFVLLENGDLYATGRVVDSLTFVPYKLDFKVEDFDLLFKCNGYSDNALVLLSKNRIFIKNVEPHYRTLNWCEYDEDNCYEPAGMHEDTIIEKIVASGDSIHVLTKNGTLYAIGNNNYGQLGIDNRNTMKSFSKVYGINDISHLAASHDSGGFIIALTDDSLYGWGTNENNQLGEDDDYYKTSYETGLIFKDKNDRKHYIEKKPKKIEELSSLLTVGNEFEIACGNETTYLYDYTDSKVYFFSKNIRVTWFNNNFGESWIVASGENCYKIGEAGRDWVYYQG